jgi:hypothetical protein
VWECSTCHELFAKRDGGRREAVRCCNDAIHEAEQKAREKRARAAVAKVAKPTVAFERNALRRTYAVATARCPISGCNYSSRIRVAVADSWNGGLTKVEAAKRAAPLALARIGIHVRSYRHRT